MVRVACRMLRGASVASTFKRSILFVCAAAETLNKNTIHTHVCLIMNAPPIRTKPVMLPFAEGLGEANSMTRDRFSRIVFLLAGIYGIGVLAPGFFSENVTSRLMPPAITHP